MGRTVFLTNQLIPREKNPFLEKLIVPHPVKKFPEFYITSFLHKIQTFLLSQMKPIHDPASPYIFTAKTLVKCTCCIEIFGCVQSTSLVRCLLTVQKIMFPSFGASLFTRLHSGITHKTSISHRNLPYSVHLPLWIRWIWESWISKNHHVLEVTNILYYIILYYTLQNSVDYTLITNLMHW